MPHSTTMSNKPTMNGDASQSQTISVSETLYVTNNPSLDGFFDENMDCMKTILTINLAHHKLPSRLRHPQHLPKQQPRSQDHLRIQVDGHELR